MRIDYLSERPAGTAFVAGDAGERTLATVIVRTSYDLIGGNPRTMTPSSDAALHAVVMADEHVTVDLHPGPDVTYWHEADIALEKPLADIVVLGRLRSDTNTAQVRVDGNIWLRRNANPATQDDSRANLFGFHPRGVGGRNLARETGQPPPNDWALDMAADYQPQVNNYHKRTSKFTPASPGETLPEGAIVEVQDIGGATKTYSLRLPGVLAMQARYFTYCGHGTDKLPFWNPGPAIDLRPDSLIIDVVADTGVIIWRGSWDFADHAPDIYRTIQVVEGGFV